MPRSVIPFLILLALAARAGAAEPFRAAGPGRSAGPAADERSAAATEPGVGTGPVSVQLDLVVHHRLTEGRMVVRLEDEAYLSIPMALTGGTSEPYERRLSIPAGRHAITVQFLDGSGRVVAEETTREPEPSGRPALLSIAEHSGSGDGLTLDWRTP